MGKVLKQSDGFGVIEGLLIVLVLAVIGFGGYYVYHAQKKPNKTTGSSATTKQMSVSKSTLKPAAVKLLSGTASNVSTPTADAESTINKVSVVRPNDWRPDANITAQGCSVTTGLANCLGQVYIVPENEDEEGATYPDYFVVTVSAFQTTQNAKTVFANNWQDSSPAATTAYSDFTTNDGVTGFKYDFESNGTDASGGYTEHVAYGISNGSDTAIIDVTYFNGTHNGFANKTNTDYGQYAAAVEQIAKSLHIAQ